MMQACKPVSDICTFDVLAILFDGNVIFVSVQRLLGHDVAFQYFVVGFVCNIFTLLRLIFKFY